MLRDSLCCIRLWRRNLDFDLILRNLHFHSILRNLPPFSSFENHFRSSLRSGWCWWDRQGGRQSFQALRNSRSFAVFDAALCWLGNRSTKHCSRRTFKRDSDQLVLDLREGYYQFSMIWIKKIKWINFLSKHLAFSSIFGHSLLVSAESRIHYLKINHKNWIYWDAEKLEMIFGFSLIFNARSRVRYFLLQKALMRQISFFKHITFFQNQTCAQWKVILSTYTIII